MEQYDFRNNAKTAAKIGLEFDGMTTKQLQSLKDAIEDIKRAGDRDELAYYSSWFDRVLLPIWKDFAERTSSLLEVERYGDGMLEVLLRNPNGIDVMENCRAFYMILIMATGITVQADGGDVNLSMTYDCRKFIN